LCFLKSSKNNKLIKRIIFSKREIIKNVIIGYIKVTHQQEKKQALKLISLMLNFTPTEIEQVESLSESKWSISNLLTNTNKTASTPNRLAEASSSSLNKSFTELLIQYVDRESKPKPTFSFDLNDPNMTVTNKKTDSPGKSSAEDAKNTFNSGQESSIMRASNSSSNLVLLGGGSGGSTHVLNKDAAVVNRNQQQQQTSKNAISGLASPATANNFLEQILK